MKRIIPKLASFIDASLIVIAAALMAVLLITACKTPKLAPGGAYTGSVTNIVGTNLVITATSDLALYSADSSFALAYKTLDAIFLTERNNRDYFWKVSPQIKHTLDKVRVQAQKVVSDYAAARTAYIANPTPAGLTGVQSVLAQIQQLVFVGNAVLGQIISTNAPSITN